VSELQKVLKEIKEKREGCQMYYDVLIQKKWNDKELAIVKAEIVGQIEQQETSKLFFTVCSVMISIFTSAIFSGLIVDNIEKAESAYMIMFFVIVVIFMIAELAIYILKRIDKKVKLKEILSILTDIEKNNKK